MFFFSFLRGFPAHPTLETCLLTPKHQPLWRLVYWHPNINCIVSGMGIQCYSTNFKRQVYNVLNFALRTVAAWTVSATAESGRSPVKIGLQLLQLPSGITKTFHESLKKTASIQSCLDTPKPMVYHHLTLPNHRKTCIIFLHMEILQSPETEITLQKSSKKTSPCQNSYHEEVTFFL